MNKTENRPIDIKTFPLEQRPSVITGVCKFPTDTKKNVGRPKKNISWPKEEFTFEDVLNLNPNLSRSSVRNKIIENLKTEVVFKSGTVKTSFGRPKDIYKYRSLS